MNVSQKSFLMGNFVIKNKWKNKNKMEGRLPEVHITDPRNKRMVERSRRQRRMETSSQVDQDL
jgi:hypothetical protein